MKTIYWWNFHLILGCQSFYIKAFKSLEGPTPIIEGPLLYKTIDSNVNPIWKKKTKNETKPTKPSKKLLKKCSIKYLGTVANLTHKIN